jgi:UDP:flavonoid glycosyltransferase YjiC (YdhE family)
MGPDIDMSLEAGAIRDRSANPMIGLIRVMQYAFKIIEKSHSDLLQLCQDANLVVIHGQSAVGKNEAELNELPYLSVTFMPWAIPWQDPARPLLKRMGYSAFDRLISMITTRPLNGLRRKQGLPPVGREGFFSATLNLIPISPVVYSPNPLWDHSHRVVGYWFVEEPAGWKPSESLLKFLQAGEPPLLVSLGAMSFGEKSAREAMEIFLSALEKTGVRTIIQGWSDQLADRIIPGSIYSAGPIPHNWLLPRTRGIVHHGGFGTTAAGFRAGIPQLIIPHLADQFYWGQRVEELGVGLPAIYRNRLTVEKLADGLAQVETDRTLQAQANDLGKIIRAENGLPEAMRLIETTFAK